MRFKAHFDGQTIVPDEPVQLPVNAPLSIDVQLGAVADSVSATPTEQERQAAFQRLMSRPVHGPPIPDEALRREDLYDDHRNRL
jgi:hypothetical protein